MTQTPNNDSRPLSSPDGVARGDGIHREVYRPPRRRSAWRGMVRGWIAGQPIPWAAISELWKRPRVIVSTDAGFIYVPITKVASRSIRTCLAIHCGVGLGERGRDRLPRLPLSALRRRRLFRFAFCRNPYDRLHSCYAQKIGSVKTGSGSASRFWRYGNNFHADMSFADFAAQVACIPDAFADRHFRSQHTLLFHRGVLRVDFLGRFERLGTDWQTLRDRLGFPELPHLNLSATGSFQAAYSPELADLVYRRYHEDFELLGYDRESWRPGR